MTRFGMKEDDFKQLAQYIADVIFRDSNVKQEVSALRTRFLDMQYCFAGSEFEDLMQTLHNLI
jgi:glycine/serine hydroxymethyltransferase